MSVYTLNCQYWLKLTEEFRQKLLTLTLRPDSEMREILVNKRKDPEVYYLTNSTSTVLAWATITYDSWHHRNYDNYPTVMMYVDPSVRNQGLGTLLLGLIKAKYPDIKCQPWDHKSQRLFSKFKLKTYWGGQASLQSFKEE